MRFWPVMAAVLCSVPATDCSAQSPFSAGAETGTPHWYITERPVGPAADHPLNLAPTMAQPAGPPVGQPPIVAPTLSSTAFRPLVPVVRMPRSYVIGRGILGQPKLYVPGQPVRNALRYLSP